MAMNSRMGASLPENYNAQRVWACIKSCPRRPHGYVAIAHCPTTPYCFTFTIATQQLHKYMLPLSVINSKAFSSCINNALSPSTRSTQFLQPRKDSCCCSSTSWRQPIRHCEPAFEQAGPSLRPSGE